MNFPISLQSHININKQHSVKNLTVHGGLTVLLGPNGAGKTHILRGLKNSLLEHTDGKHVRFLSAGRMGLLERYRSDHDGHRGGNPNYDEAIFGGKNDASRRHQMETINGDFHTLASRADILIKIQERLRKLFQRDVLIDWDGGNLKISFTRLDSSAAPYSAGREASGLMHLVGILAALYDDDVGALLLDEPEVSLHPQLQAFLLNEILSVAGYPNSKNNKKIIIIATHSTEMLQIKNTEDLLSLVFCYDLLNDPVQISKDSRELNNKNIQNLISRLGQEHKLSLFSRRPLLVEGPSDVIICSALATKLGLHLEAAGSQILPVIGKGQIPIVAKLLRLLGKDPVALADADGIADGIELPNAYLTNNTQADQFASKLGFKSAVQMAKEIISDFSKLVDNQWSQISHIAENHPYWINKKIEENKDNTEIINKAKRRSALCSLFTSNEEILFSLSKDNSWLSIRNRLDALFNILESGGLFILRKGSIESYYLTSDKITSIEKPSAAVSEIERFNEIEVKQLEDSYSDIIRCITHASNTETISEAEALRDILLSVAAPAHARFKSNNSSLDFNMLSRSILGERSKIFSFSVKDEKLTISMESKILNIKGFPLSLKKDDDVVNVINSTLSS